MKDMKKQLFFDDGGLFASENVERKYGKPVLTETYNDGVSSSDHATGYVFRLDNGLYRMLYYARGKDFAGGKLFSAVSDDGLHFKPEALFDPARDEKAYPHEIMSLKDGQEIAFVYEDKYCDDQNERYKLLMSMFDGSLSLADPIYTSPDLINWRQKEGVVWGGGAEPLASVFYNRHKQTHTIIERPFWGVRYAGYSETKDWQNFTEYQPCLRVDSADEPLSEIYGMFAFEYDGMYIGLPHMYRGLKSELNAKFFNGVIDTQLAYSYDGRYWQRSLRQPFLSGLWEDCEPQYKLLWCFGIQRNTGGDLYLYASASELEHGPAFHQPGTGKMLIYRLRQDGFISLASRNKAEPSVVATREKIWHGGEPHFNLKAKNATVAVYTTEETEDVGGNALAFSRLIEGMGHEDCLPFGGDSTDWSPIYKTGKKVDDLKGKTLVLELRFLDGEVFSIAGEYTDVYNTQAARYRKFGVMPT